MERKVLPHPLPRRKRLAYYAARLNTVELGVSLARLPSETTVKAWAAEVPVGFRFAFAITQPTAAWGNRRRTLAKLAELDRLAGLLGRARGPSLLRLPPRQRVDPGWLRDLLAASSPRGGGAVELRNSGGDDDRIHAALVGARCNMAVVDDGDRTTRFESTARVAYVRLLRPKYTPSVLTGWLERLEAAGAAECWIYFDQPRDGWSARNATRLMWQVRNP